MQLVVEELAKTEQKAIVFLPTDLKQVALLNRAWTRCPAVLLRDHEEAKELHQQLLVGTDLWAEWRTPAPKVQKRMRYAMMCICYPIDLLCRIPYLLGVDNGKEFVVADEVASQLKVPCECIDISDSDLANRLLSKVAPSLENLFAAFRFWLSIPRSSILSLFPAVDVVDTWAVSLRHIFSFNLQTWLSIIFMAIVLEGIFFGVFTLNVDVAVKASGETENQVGTNFSYLWLVVILYLVARSEEALVADRDESVQRDSPTDAKRPL